MSDESNKRKEKGEETLLTGRRDILGQFGGAVGIASLGSLFGPDLLRRVEAAPQATGALTPQQVATDERFWTSIQQAFGVTRSVMNHAHTN